MDTMNRVSTNKQTPLIPSRVLAEYFLNHEQPVSFDDYDESNDEYIVHLHIPKTVVINHIPQTKANKVKQDKLSENAKKILEFAGAWQGMDENDDQFSTQAIENRRQSGSRDRYL